MNQIDKIARIEQYRQDFERALQAEFGIDATIQVALHMATFENFVAGCAQGWQVQLLGGNILAVQSQSRLGDIGDTTIFYHPSYDKEFAGA